MEVTATAPELVTDHPDRGNVIESQFVQNTPLNVRNPLQLVNFAQGVTAYNSQSGNNEQRSPVDGDNPQIAQPSPIATGGLGP